MEEENTEKKVLSKHEKINYTIEELTPNILEDSHGYFETLSCMSKSPDIPLEDAKTILKEIKAQGSTIYVAITDDNKIIGSITLLIEQKFIRGGGKAAHIEDVVTHTFARGQGIAKALIDRAIAHAKTEDCYKIVLDCCHNLEEFYKRYGFTIAGHFMRLDV